MTGGCWKKSLIFFYLNQALLGLTRERRDKPIINFIMPCRLRSEIILGKAAGKIASAKGFGLSSVLISAMILRKQPQSHYSIRNELKKSVVSLATSVPKVDPTM